MHFLLADCTDGDSYAGSERNKVNVVVIERLAGSFGVLCRDGNEEPGFVRKNRKPNFFRLFDENSRSFLNQLIIFFLFRFPFISELLISPDTAERFLCTPYCIGPCCAACEGIDITEFGDDILTGGNLSARFQGGRSGR